MKTIQKESENDMQISETHFREYADDSQIERVKISDDAKSIADMAFKNCKNLKYVYIEEGVESIGSESFRNCVSLSDIHMSKGVNEIGELAFYTNSPELNVYYDGTIDEWNSIKRINNDLYSLILQLECDTNYNINCKDGILASELTENEVVYKLLGNGTYSIKKYLGRGENISITIPEKLKNGGIVTTVGNYAFLDCECLTAIKLPDSIKHIGYRAFDGCSNLTKVDLPKALDILDDGAFAGCVELLKIELPNEIEHFGAEVFLGCSDKLKISWDSDEDPTVPEYYFASFNNQDIYEWEELGDCFTRDDLDEILEENEGITRFDFADHCLNGGDSISSIANNAFEDCSQLTEIVLPKTIKYIGDCAFRGCTGLKEIVIPEGIRFIGRGAFLGCSRLSSVTLPNSLLRVDKLLFEDCQLQDLTLPFVGRFRSNKADEISCILSDNNVLMPTSLKNVTFNGKHIKLDSAFKNCLYLESIGFSDNVSSIEIKNNMCILCPSLEAIHIHDLENWCETEISGPILSGLKLYVNGKLLQDDLIIPNDTYFIKKYVFAECKSLKKIIIPKSVEEIDNRAFEGCTSLESIVVDPDNERYCSKNNCLIDKKKQSLVLGCKNSTIPSDCTVKYIERGAFCGVNLTEITIPASIDKIDDEAFRYCHKLVHVKNHSGKDFTSPALIAGEVISEGEFTTDITTYYAHGVKTYKVGNDIYLIDCFNNPTELDLSLLKYITHIYPYAFSGCTNLKKVILPPTVNDISESAFFGCGNLQSIEIADDNKHFKTKDGILYKQEENNVFSIFVVPKNLSGTIELIDGVKQISTADIGDRTNFMGRKKLEEVIFSDSVQKIDSFSFWNCIGLKRIIFPKEMEIVAEQTLVNCISLETIRVYENINTLFSNAFINCPNLSVLRIDAGIGQNAEKCLDEVCLLETRNSESVCCPQTLIAPSIAVREITKSQFSHKLERIIFIGNTDIPSFLFYPSSVFYGIKQIVVCEGIKKVGRFAFSYALFLHTVFLPKSLKMIEATAFQYCESLNSILYFGTIAEWNEIEKGDDWDKYTGNYIVHCTDGKIYKNNQLEKTNEKNQMIMTEEYCLYS